MSTKTLPPELSDPGDTTTRADVYRLVTPDHVCPYGLKTVDLLRREGIEFTDHHLETEEEAAAVREQLGVETTPQTFIDGELIGTLDDVRRFVGRNVPDDDEVTYRPVLSLFALMFLMALGAAAMVEGQVFSVLTVEWFVAFTMVGLAYLKLRDVESFSLMFLNYDLLARRFVPYSYVYPYGEAAAGLLMVAQVLPWLSAPIALFIGTVGAVSVIKAVYVDGRELKCACVGGNSNVPLGFISLTENLAMMGMGIWTGIKLFT